MRILILRSVPNRAGQDPYAVKMDTHYAGRFIGHLTDRGDYCRACQDKCVACRGKYGLDFSERLAGVIELPAVLPVMIDDAGTYLPKNIPACDVVVAVSVNEELLLGFAERFSSYKGMIVPIEGSDWISPNFIAKITRVCDKNGVETSFPKPFCSFNPAGGILKEFREKFRIGRPEVEYDIQYGFIAEARVKVSAPCGATYYTCRGLTGKEVDDDLTFIIDNRLSAYPCTADHAVDREFNDSITHEAVKIQREILAGLKCEK
ncbi:DUF166 family protein [Fibrobacterota bacterium]